MKLLIHLAAVEHQAGMDLHAAPSGEALDAILADYCRSNWDNDPDTKLPPCPDSDAAVIGLYFEDHDKDTLTRDITSIEIPTPC
jgi:hypothetical protein